MPSRLCVLTSVFVTRADFHVSTHFIGLFKRQHCLSFFQHHNCRCLCCAQAHGAHEYKLSLHTKGGIIKVWFNMSLSSECRLNALRHCCVAFSYEIELGSKKKKSFKLTEFKQSLYSDGQTWFTRWAFALLRFGSIINIECLCSFQHAPSLFLYGLFEL